MDWRVVTALDGVPRRNPDTTTATSRTPPTHGIAAEISRCRSSLGWAGGPEIRPHPSDHPPDCPNPNSHACALAHQPPPPVANRLHPTPFSSFAHRAVGAMSSWWTGCCCGSCIFSSLHCQRISHPILLPAHFFPSLPSSTPRTRVSILSFFHVRILSF